MGKWKSVSFEEVVDNLDGKRIPIKASERKSEDGGKYPYYGASGIIDYVDEFIFEGEHLLISEDGANLLARVYPIAFKANGKFWVNNHAHIVKAKVDKTSNDYLEYYFSSIDISDYVTGSAQPKLNQKKLNSIKIPLPPLSEQQRIVTKLDDLFAKIDQAINLLEENVLHTQALMGSVLDAEFGKLESKFGKVELISLCDKITDGSHHSPKSIEKGIPYVTVRDVSWDGEIDTVNCKKISKSDFMELQRSGCKPLIGDVLLSKDGTVGKVAIVDFDINWVVLSSLAIIRPNKNKLDSVYLSWILKTPRIQDLAIGLKTGAAIKRIVLKTIKIIEIPIPNNLKEQERISQYFDNLNKPYQNLLKTQTQKLTNLKALKSSLLDQAFKGEL